MPRRDYNLKASFDAEYYLRPEGRWGHPNTRQGVVLRYNRAVLYDYAVQTAQGIVGAMGWIAPGPSILLFGAGFSWLAEALEDLEFDRVVGIDTSTWIQSVKNSDEVDEIDAAIEAVGLDPNTGEGLEVRNKIRGLAKGPGNRTRASRGCLNENGRTGASRGRIKQALGISGNDLIDWGLTENLAPGFDDAEVLEASSDLDQICTQSVHLVPTLGLGNDQDPILNWKTLADWKALVPSHSWLEAGTYRLL
jgi:hypothetical protein